MNIGGYETGKVSMLGTVKLYTVSRMTRGLFGEGADPGKIVGDERGWLD